MTLTRRLSFVVATCASCCLSVSRRHSESTRRARMFLASRCSLPYTSPKWSSSCWCSLGLARAAVRGALLVAVQHGARGRGDAVERADHRPGRGAPASPRRRRRPAPRGSARPLISIARESLRAISACEEAGRGEGHRQGSEGQPAPRPSVVQPHWRSASHAVGDAEAALVQGPQALRELPASGAACPRSPAPWRGQQGRG